MQGMKLHQEFFSGEEKNRMKITKDTLNLFDRYHIQWYLPEALTGEQIIQTLV